MRRPEKHNAKRGSAYGRVHSPEFGLYEGLQSQSQVSRCWILRHRWRTYFFDHDSTETVRDEENRPMVIALSL